MDKNIKKWTPRKIKVIELLIAGQSVIEAAEAAGVRRSTVYTWLKQPEFISALKEARAEAMDRLGLLLSALGDKAINALGAAIDNPDAGPAVKIRAADIVLNRLLELRYSIDFEARILELEATVLNQKGAK